MNLTNKQIPIVVAIIRNEAGEILIAQRNQPDAPEIHGLWEFVGGGIEENEDPVEAIKREVKEEIGVEISEAQLLHKIVSDIQEFSSGSIKQFLILTFECKISSGEPKVCDPEISQLKFVPLNEVKNYKAFNNIYQTVDLLLK